MSFGQFLTNPEIKVIIITHSDIFQGTAMLEPDDKYTEISTIVNINMDDAKKIGVKSDDNVIIKNTVGKIVVKVKLSPEDQKHSGTAFMVNSPWSNALVGTGTNGIPNFKYIEANLSKAKEEKITSLEELIKFN